MGSVRKEHKINFKRMHIVKTGLFIVITILCLTSAKSQELGQWSSWRSNEVFNDLEVRYKITTVDGSNKNLEVECRNDFSSNLTFYLVYAPNLKKPNAVKLEINPDQILKIKFNRINNSPEFDLFIANASFTPAWGKNFNLYKR